MAGGNLFGSRVRALRRREGMTQSELAERLGVSPSYVNLIENNRRPLSANLLLRLAREFTLDLGDFTSGEDSQSAHDLAEALGDPVFGDLEVDKSEIIELATSMPNVVSAVLRLYRAYRSASQSVGALSEKLAVDETLIKESPTEEVNDFIQSRGNYFPRLEKAAEELWRQANLRPGEIYSGLMSYLKTELSIETRLNFHHDADAMRRYDPERRIVQLNEVLPPRTRRFQLAHQVGLLSQSDLLDEMSGSPQLTTPAARALARVVMANYFAAAVLMPYDSFRRAAYEVRYDLELLAHR